MSQLKEQNLMDAPMVIILPGLEHFESRPSGLYDHQKSVSKFYENVTYSIVVS